MLRAINGYKYIIFAITVLLYNLVYFHRVSTNALADALIKDINVNATQLGTISSTYFICYAIFQPIVGILTDKIGAKNVLIFFSCISIAGCVSFSFVNDFYTAIIARSLIGIGVSGIFIPSMKLLSTWFEPQKFARVNGVYIGIGHSGALIATTPLYYLCVNFGWRNVFVIFAIITLLLTLASLVFLFENPNKQEIEPLETTPVNFNEAINELLHMKNFWLLVVIFFATFGAYMSFQGLWANKCIISIMNVPCQTANDLVLFIPAGVIIGSLVGGFLSDKVFYSRIIPLKIGLFSILTCWLLITFFSSIIPVILMSLIFLILGIGGGILLPLVFVIIKDCTHPSLLGTSLGLINPAYFLGIFTYQILTGYILDSNMVNNHYAPHSYFIMMLFCLFTIIITTVLSFFMTETFPKARLESINKLSSK